MYVTLLKRYQNLVLWRNFMWVCPYVWPTFCWVQIENNILFNLVQRWRDLVGLFSRLSVCLSVCLSLCLSVYLSCYLSCNIYWFLVQNSSSHSVDNVWATVMAGWQGILSELLCAALFRIVICTHQQFLWMTAGLDFVSLCNFFLTSGSLFVMYLAFSCTFEHCVFYNIFDYCEFRCHYLYNRLPRKTCRRNVSMRCPGHSVVWSFFWLRHSKFVT